MYIDSIDYVYMVTSHLVTLFKYISLFDFIMSLCNTMGNQEKTRYIHLDITNLNKGKLK